MFQVEPILWLQSFESPELTWVMTTISFLGYTPVYASLLIIIIFGIRMKQGFFVFLALVLCGLSTHALKNGLAFPRPSDIDSMVVEPGHIRPPLLMDNGGADSFWSLPKSEALEATRMQTDWSYGLPSGHVSSVTAFFIALAFFFKSRKILGFSMVWIVLMSLSRMYLGRHFIADVFGGVLLGLLVIAFTIFLVGPLQAEVQKESNKRPLLRWTILVIFIVILVPFVELLDKENVGRFLGLYVTYAFLQKVGFPMDRAKIWKRITRVIVTVVAYVLVQILMNKIMDYYTVDENSLSIILILFLLTFIPIYGTIILTKKLKLFEVS